MNRYDIGILSFWDVPNYGTFMQAYALQRVIQKLYPNRAVKQIAHLDEKHQAFYYSRLPQCSPLKKYFYKDLVDRNSGKTKKRRKLFTDSYRKIAHTEAMDGEALAQASFKTVVLGSDIVWDYSFECFNHDPFLFGCGFRAEQIISYAASFGTVASEEKHPEYVISGIREMDHISVRDKNSAKIVETITGRTPDLVLDPTWLWDFSTDTNIISPPYENYMVVYGQDFTDEFIRQIIDYAKEKKLKIVCLDCNNDHYDWCDVVIRQHELSPFAWIGYFRDAQVVATSTFHGLTFSLIFNKVFAFCKTDFILAKAGEFLKEIGLYEKFVSDHVTVKDMLDGDWNYDKINEIIAQQRHISLSYLKQAITD